MEIENELKQIIDEYFNDSEYKVIEYVLRGEKGTKVFEIFVDHKDAINIDELARINKNLNELVDKKLVINDISKLTVSSPGAERPIKFLWQLNKHLGRTLEMEFTNGDKAEGKLIRISDEGDEIFAEVTHREKGRNVDTELKEINFKDIKELKVKISFSKIKK